MQELLQWFSSDSFLMALALSFMDDLLSLCYFLGSHPLQLAYLLFFSSYILRAFSFLSPLIFLTILLLIITFPFSGDPQHLPLGSTCRMVVSALLHSQEHDPDRVGAVGFLGPILLELETCADLVEKAYSEQDPQNKEDEESPEAQEAAALPVIGWEEFEAIGKLYQALTHEMGEYPLKLAIMNLKKKQLSASELHLLQVEEGKDAPLKRNGEKEAALEGWETPSSELDEFYDESPTSIIRRGPQPCWVDAKISSLERFGSGRKDKEWKRTLACKLYEERWVKCEDLEDEEGMDLLWEEHDVKNKYKENSFDEKSNKKKMMAMAKRSTSRRNTEEKIQKAEEAASRQLSRSKRVEEEDDDDDDDDEDDVVAPICCLQALRFSTKRMGFGMGKMKNLMKVSKAIKGGVNLIRNQSRKNRGA